MERVLWPSGTLRVENNVIRPAPGELRAPAGLSRIYLLVHGFNNDRAKARESYQAFRERIAETIGPNSLRKIWEFYWPGYEEISVGSMGATEGRGWLSKFYTALNYHRQVSKAIEFGEILGRYLLSLGTPDNPTEIVFIGHSLGCRLILEQARLASFPLLHAGLLLQGHGPLRASQTRFGPEISAIRRAG